MAPDRKRLQQILLRLPAPLIAALIWFFSSQPVLPQPPGILGFDKLQLTKAILAHKPIDVFNHGEMERDFTYIDDIIEGMYRVVRVAPAGKGEWDGVQCGISPAPARIYNIGNGSPCRLSDLIQALEAELGVKAQVNMLPMQPGDVAATWADCTALEGDIGYRPNTDIRAGIKRFAAWYREFYRNVS